MNGIGHNRHTGIGPNGYSGSGASSSSKIKITDPATESISGTATTQQEVNAELVKYTGQKRVYITTPATEWAFAHLLNKMPAVKCYDENNIELIGSVEYPTLNDVKVVFAFPQKGLMIVN